MLCTDDCLPDSRGPGGPYANNTFCQDGADEEGVTGYTCAFGTDCTDCGPRYMMPPSSPPPPPPSSPPPSPPSPPPCDVVAGFYNDASSGYRYARMDGTSYDSTVAVCQLAYYNLPTGWELAPADSDGIRIAG
eukprot:scaffold654_cov34-Phaeocystis_antarctica.AAC.1